MNHLGNVLQVADAVVDEIDLPVARHLEVDGIGNDFGSEGVNLRLDGISVRRRRLYDAQVAGTDERELQGTRDGGCRHGERIDVRLHLAQLLLGGHTELLLLVDDEQSEVTELHALADELVRTYYNIYLSVL